MKRKILSVIVLLITTGAILSQTGCSCLFSSMAMFGEPKTITGTASEIKFESVSPGKEVILNQIDGSEIKGEYIGLDSMPAEGPETNENLTKESKALFLQAIALQDTSGKTLVPINKIELIQIKSEKPYAGNAFLLGLAIDIAALILIWPHFINVP
jgi:hypothetical protein